MKVEIDIAKIKRNIDKAKSLTSSSISLMFKDFYEDINTHLGDVGCRIFSKNIKNSICYSLFNASEEHSGCFVTTYGDYIFNRTVNGIKEFYVPINANDEREGLCIEETIKLCKKLKRTTILLLYTERSPQGASMKNTQPKRRCRRYGIMSSLI